MKNYLLFLIISWWCCANTTAQDVPFEKSNFIGLEAQFASAKVSYDKGMEYFYNEPPLYEVALTHFLKAYDFNPKSSDLSFKIGLCYLNSSQKYEALAYFENAVIINSSVHSQINFYLGAAHHINHDWVKAKAFYEAYRGQVSKDKSELGLVDKRLLECSIGEKLTANPVKVKIENLGANVNSEFAEYSPHITADESQLFFTARRKDTYGGARAEVDGKYYEDIYMCTRGADGKWLVAKNLGSPLNSKIHDATSGLSPDGHTLFVFKGDEGNGDIFVSTLGSKGWSTPTSLGKNINTNDHESSASLSPDGNTLFFVSDRKGGMGLRDIYYTKYDEKKKAWGEAINMGAPVNSIYDEEGVWMHPDGKTLYFSSKGNGSMGGYDIFYSRYENGVWDQPVNLGYPINSADDDVFIEMSASGLTLYYASFKRDGLGEKDIYSARYEEELNLRAKVALYKGFVFDEDSKSPVSATIELIDLEKNEPIGKFNTDASTGKFLVSLPAGKNYGAVIQADGYLFSSDNFNIPDTADYNEYNKDIYLKPVVAGSAIILNNIFFETSKWDLKNQSANEMQRLVGFLNSNPKMRIEIAGHTDNVGNADGNQKLSENRAKAVVDYLLSKGVDATRLTYKGYGETQPVTSNETNEGRALNRRTEFRILGN
jgi:outer membrane protein OmpA-like peptidoglycan-associated protein